MRSLGIRNLRSWILGSKSKRSFFDASGGHRSAIDPELSTKGATRERRATLLDRLPDGGSEKMRAIDSTSTEVLIDAFMPSVPELHGPPVFAIGWIPFRSVFTRLPGAFAEHPRRLTRLALKGVFGSGNAPPPESFDGFDGLQRFMRGKDFRSIVGFHKVVYPADVSWRPPPESHELIAVSGYTPYTLPFGVEVIRRKLAYFSEGDEFQAASFLRDPTRTWLPLEKTIHFRIGRMGNRISKWLTGHEAPFAFLECQYKLHSDGKFNFEFYGSLIPSYTFYVNWKAVGSKSVLYISAYNLNDFLAADTNARAGMPRRSCLFTFKGHVRDYET